MAITRCGIFCGSDDLPAFVDVEWSETIKQQSLDGIYGEITDAKGHETPLDKPIRIGSGKKRRIRFETRETKYAPGPATLWVTIDGRRDDARTEAVEDLLDLTGDVGEGAGSTVGGGIAGGGDHIAENIARTAAAAEQIADSEAVSAAAEQQLVEEGAAALQLSQDLRDTGERINRSVGAVTDYRLVVTSEDGIEPGGGAPSIDSVRPVQRAFKALIGRVPARVSARRPDRVVETLAAMDAAIVQKNVNGNETWEFERQTAIRFNSVGAGVTGQRAALVSFAGNVRVQISDLLGDLRPVRATTGNPRRPEALVALTNNALESFEGEVSSDYGPDAAKAALCLDRARNHLQALGIYLGLAIDADEADPDSGFAYDQGNIIVPDDAADSGKFIAAIELLDMLMFAWERYVQSGETDYGLTLGGIELLLESLDDLAAQARSGAATLGFGQDQLMAIPVDEGPFAPTLQGVLEDVEDTPQNVRTQLEEGGTIGAGDAVQEIAVLRAQVQAAEQSTPNRFADDAPVGRVTGPLGAIDQTLAELESRLGDFAASFGTANGSANGGVTTARSRRRRTTSATS
jgi:hypothetical protein